MKSTLYKIFDIGDRDEQQDSADIFQKETATLLVLADGMGGHHGGKMASSCLVSMAKKAFIDMHGSGTEEFFNTIVSTTSTEIRYYKKNHSESDPHTTCVMALVQDGVLYHGHIGDSRLYLFSDKTLYKRTKDHSYVQVLVEMGELEEEEMGTHPDQNKLLKSISEEEGVTVAYAEEKLPEKPALLLCSDGFWEYVSEEEMANALYSKDTTKELEILVLKAKERAGEGGDNISLVAWKEKKKLFGLF